MVMTAGIDLGSTYTKIAVVKDDELVGYGIGPTGAYPDKTAEKLLDKAMADAGLKRAELGYIVSTGYGRRIMSIANEVISEISANAQGARWVGSEAGVVHTIVDIGGQDTKVISLDDDLQIRNFKMNDKCAAGTGRFLEVMAKTLKIELSDLGDVSLKSKKYIEIDSTCVVFAKSEINSLIAKGHHKTDIVAAIHRSVAQRLALMVRAVGLEEVVFFDGGPARNVGMRKALEDELNVKLYVPKNPQIVTSIGAAILARKKLEEQDNGH
ncbi:MAG: CoA activase [Thermoplasmata archaeon]|nr:MAG: CoA activase [Thermoplasmata archaeon]